MAVLGITTDWSFLHISGLTLMGAATLIAFYVGRLARLARLPSLIGYMLVGVILGPSILHLFDEASMERLAFITEIALGFVAFSIGSELPDRAMGSCTDHKENSATLLLRSN